MMSSGHAIADAGSSVLSGAGSAIEGVYHQLAGAHHAGEEGPKVPHAAPPGSSTKKPGKPPMGGGVKKPVASQEPNVPKPETP
jgi:hypothetical protein